VTSEGRPAAGAGISLGAVLSRSFGFCRRHLLLLLFVGAVCVLPREILTGFYWWDLIEGDGQSSHTMIWLIFGLAFVSPLLVEGALSFAVFQHMRGGAVHPGRSVVRGLASLPSILGVALLLLLALAPTYVLNWAIWRWMWPHMPSIEVSYLISLGMYCVVALVQCTFFVPVQVVVVERMGPWRAMGRSRRLTRGARWRIFALLLLTYAAGLGARLAVESSLASTFETTMEFVLWRLGPDAAVELVLTALTAVWSTVVYHDLRRAKEGLGIEELLRVFE